jgi:hypothetical protein
MASPSSQSLPKPKPKQKQKRVPTERNERHEGILLKKMKAEAADTKTGFKTKAMARVTQSQAQAQMRAGDMALGAGAGKLDGGEPGILDVVSASLAAANNSTKEALGPVLSRCQTTGLTPQVAAGTIKLGQIPEEAEIQKILEQRGGIAYDLFKSIKNQLKQMKTTFRSTIEFIKWAGSYIGKQTIILGMKGATNMCIFILDRFLWILLIMTVAYTMYNSGLILQPLNNVTPVKLADGVNHVSSICCCVCVCSHEILYERIV